MTRDEAIKTLGGEVDEWWSYFVDNRGIEYDNLEDYIWCGLFGFCGCGDPMRELEKIKEALSCAKNHLYLPDELQIYGYLLDRGEFTEHGTSIYGAWLTPKGEALLTLLNELEK